MKQFLIIVLILFFATGIYSQQAGTITNNDNSNRTRNASEPSISELKSKNLIPLGILCPNDEVKAFALESLSLINEDKTILKDYDLQFVDPVETRTYEKTTNDVLNLVKEGVLGFVGPGSYPFSKLVAVTTGDYNMTMVGYDAGDPELSNKETYPFFFRTNPSFTVEGRAIADLVHHYKWTDISVITENSDYGLALSNGFLSQASRLGIKIDHLYYISLKLPRIEVGLLEARDLGLRIIVVLTSKPTFKNVLFAADRLNMIGKPYVYVCSGNVLRSYFDGSSASERKKLISFTKGTIGLGVADGHASQFELRKYYKTVDQIPPEGEFLVLSILAFANAFDKLLEKDKVPLTRLNGTLIRDALRVVKFDDVLVREGETELLEYHFDVNGENTQPIFTVYNFQEDNFSVIGQWINGSLRFSSKPHWPKGFNQAKIPPSEPSGTVIYFSCPDEKVYNDTRGLIEIDSVRSDPTNIEEDSNCDGIVDCDNHADEGFDCTPSILIGYIVISIFAFVGYIYLAFCLFIIFSYRKRGRIRAVGVIFLLLSTLACIIGLSSLFTFFGKPTTAVCILRCWLLAISSGLLIGSLSARQYRVWKVFSNKSINPVAFTELRLTVLCLSLIVPDIIILILWTAIDPLKATVTSDNHLVCESDFSLLFFLLLVVYKAIISLLSTVLAIISRNFPAAYSDARLIGFAIYNETIAGIILLPIIAVLQSEYFVQWILIMLSILFFFLSTYSIIMVPKIYGLLFIDKGKSSSELADLPSQTKNTSRHKT